MSFGEPKTALTSSSTLTVFLLLIFLVYVTTLKDLFWAHKMGLASAAPKRRLTQKIGG